MRRDRRLNRPQRLVHVPQLVLARHALEPALDLAVAAKVLFPVDGMLHLLVELGLRPRPPGQLSHALTRKKLRGLSFHSSLRMTRAARTGGPNAALLGGRKVATQIFCVCGYAQSGRRPRAPTRS